MHAKFSACVRHSMSCQIAAQTCTLFQTLPCSIDFWLRSWCPLCFAEVVTWGMKEIHTWTHNAHSCKPNQTKAML